MVAGLKISIIVPIYKVEAYLEKCIDSLVYQTYKDLEIILVDDGSPDNCGKICDVYAKNDSRIKVIHKQNAGVAMARNDGIDAATGELISFVDSDDWLALDTYEVLYNELSEKNADCVVGGCVVVYDREGKFEYKKRASITIFEEDSVAAMKRVLLGGSAVWNRLFKREIFDSVRFPQNRINDDEMVALHAYSKCKKIVYLDKDTYYYRIRKNSVTTSSFSLRKVDVYYNAKDNLEFIREQCPSLVPCAEYKLFKAILYCKYNMSKVDDSEEKKKVINSLNNDIVSYHKKTMHNKYLGIKYKVLWVIYRVLIGS